MQRAFFHCDLMALDVYWCMCLEGRNGLFNHVSFSSCSELRTHGASFTYFCLPKHIRVWPVHLPQGCCAISRGSVFNETFILCSTQAHVLIEGWEGTINPSLVDLHHFSFSNRITSMASTLNNYPIRGKGANGAKPPGVLQEEIRLWSFHYLKILHWLLIALRIKHKLLFNMALQRPTISCLHRETMVHFKHSICYPTSLFPCSHWGRGHVTSASQQAMGICDVCLF